MMMVFTGVSLATAQSSEISGKVFDENGQPMPFVNVGVKGTTTGAITDLDGKFNLNAAPENVLIVSFIGYETIEVPVGTQKQIEVKMVSTTTQLEEVMVVAYGTTKKQSFTGSASVVKADNIEKMPVVSLDQAMAGTVSGLQVSGSSGQPGSAASIRIRGVGSINADKDPLFVIDGVPVQSGDYGSFSSSSSNLLATMNPNDIESMTVLKDAAAASLYGSRAANGVVLITTKKGKKGKTKFRFKAEGGISDFATDNIEIVDGDTEREIKHEGLVNYFLDRDYTLGEAQTLADENIDDVAPKMDEYNDWIGELFQVGKNQSYEFSANGGDEKTTFFTSVGYTEQQGVIKGSDFNRISGRLNLDHKATDFVKFGANLGISKSVQNAIPDAGAYYANPFFATRYFLTPSTNIYNEDGSYNEDIPAGRYPNLLKDQGLNVQRNNTFRSMNTAYAQLDLAEGLNFRSTFGLDAVMMDMDRYWSPVSNDGKVHNGYGEKGHRILTTTTSSNVLNYDKEIGKHNFNLLAGYEVEDLSNEFTRATANQYPNVIVTTIENASTPTEAFNYNSSSRMISYLSRINYDYAGKYYASASFRRDGSSRLNPDVRWANFWSASASWRISQEDFLKDLLWLDDWKIRASFGTNGTLPGSYYDHYRLFGFGNNYDGLPGSVLENIPSPDLSWEKSNNFNIGTEISVFEKLKVEAEYFYKRTNDLLMDVRISKTIGLPDGEITKNVGEIENKGFEITLTSTNIRTTDFEWTTALNLSHYANKVIELSGGEDITDNFPFILREGESINSLYLREWAGVDPATGQGMWYKNTTDDDGNIISGRETTTSSSEAEKIIVGVTDPDITGGLNNTIRWKNFDASLLFTFRMGGSTYDGTSYHTENDGRMPYAPIRVSQLDRWQNPGDITDVPRYVYGNSTNSNYNSSRRIHDADYIRLKSINLGYTLPSNITSRVNISSARLYASAMNLWTWAAYDGYDPEVDIDGSFGYNLPPVKTVNFGVEINL